jgi:hypothetical protein
MVSKNKKVYLIGTTDGKIPGWNAKTRKFETSAIIDP